MSKSIQKKQNMRNHSKSVTLRKLVMRVKSIEINNKTLYKMWILRVFRLSTYQKNLSQ